MTTQTESPERSLRKDDRRPPESQRGAAGRNESSINSRTVEGTPRSERPIADIDKNVDDGKS